MPTDGSAPRKLAIDTSGWLVREGIRLSPSGTHIAFFTGKDASEVWALESVAQR